MQCFHFSAVMMTINIVSQFGLFDALAMMIIYLLMIMVLEN